MSMMGTNWAAAMVQAKWRGRKTRAIIKTIWAEAELMTAAAMEKADAEAEAAKAKRLAKWNAEEVAKQEAEEARLAALCVLAPAVVGGPCGAREARLGEGGAKRSEA